MKTKYRAHDPLVHSLRVPFVAKAPCKLIERTVALRENRGPFDVSAVGDFMMFVKGWSEITLVLAVAVVDVFVFQFSSFGLLECAAVHSQESIVLSP